MKQKFELKEVMWDDGSSSPRDSINGEVEITKEAIFIRPKGYGDFCSADGQGCPIVIEFCDGNMRVAVWGDINQEDPTHIINLKDARESNRKEESPSWIDRHSVNCFHCGELVDERDCVPNVDEGGSICPKCISSISILKVNLF